MLPVRDDACRLWNVQMSMTPQINHSFRTMFILLIVYFDSILTHSHQCKFVSSIVVSIFLISLNVRDFHYIYSFIMISGNKFSITINEWNIYLSTGFLHYFLFLFQPFYEQLKLLQRFDVHYFLMWQKVMLDTPFVSLSMTHKILYQLFNHIWSTL